MVRTVGVRSTTLPARSRQSTVETCTPSDASKAMPMRRKISMRSAWVPMPEPRLSRSSVLRSNTTTSQPMPRNRCAARSPPSEPPITSARRWGMGTSSPFPSPACGGGSGRDAKSRHRPGHLVVAGAVIAVGLGGIAVDQRAGEHRVALRAHLVLDREEHLARIEIDHIVEAILELVELDCDQVAIDQFPVGP